MYTGIVQACLPISRLKKDEGLYSFSIPFSEDLMLDLETGASVSVNGVCFTVTGFADSEVSFDEQNNEGVNNKSLVKASIVSKSPQTIMQQPRPQTSQPVKNL